MPKKNPTKQSRRLLLRGKIARREQQARKSNPKKNFTKRWIDSLPPAEVGERDVYLDETTPHLRLRVSPERVRTFY